jgi:hypothetical protein
MIPKLIGFLRQAEMEEWRQSKESEVQTKSQTGRSPENIGRPSRYAHAVSIPLKSTCADLQDHGEGKVLQDCSLGSHHFA